MAGNPNDMSAYEELCLPNEREKKKQRAQETIKPAQKGEKVNSEILIVSLNLINIDFNDPKNILVLINLLNNDRSFKNKLFNIKSKHQNTSSRPAIDINNISDDLFKAAFGLIKYNEYIKNKEKWRKDAANQIDIDKTIKDINGNVEQFISKSTKELKKQIGDKLKNDIEFGYNLFARWDIPDGQRALPTKILKKWALLNPGAALGMLINPKLRAKLLSSRGLTEEDQSTLLKKAESISNDPIKYPKQQHYKNVTSTLLTKQKPENVTEGEKVVASFLSSDDINESLETGKKALYNFLAKDNLTTFSDQKPGTENHVAISKKTGTIISLFTDKFNSNSAKDSAITTLVTELQPNIDTLIRLHSSQTNPTQKAALKHQMDLLFSNPEISKRLDVSEDMLTKLATNKTILPNEILTYRHTLKNYTRLTTTTTISDDAAFIIVNKPALWKQLDPAQRHPIRAALNKWFGWFEDNFKKKKDKLVQLNPIFGQKIDEKTIQDQLVYIQEEQEKKKNTTVAIDETQGQIPDQIFITPQKHGNTNGVVTPQHSTPVFGTPRTSLTEQPDSTFCTPEKSAKTPTISENDQTFATPQRDNTNGGDTTHVTPQCSTPVYGTPQASSTMFAHSDQHKVPENQKNPDTTQSQSHFTPGGNTTIQ